MDDKTIVGPVRGEVVNRDIAEADFKRFAASRDMDTSQLVEEDNDLHEAYEGVIKGLVGGYVKIDEEDRPVFTPRYSDNKKPLVFHRPTGATMLSLDSKGVNQNVGRTFAAAGNITKQGEAYFATMDGVDAKVVGHLVSLFLG